MPMLMGWQNGMNLLKWMFLTPCAFALAWSMPHTVNAQEQPPKEAANQDAVIIQDFEFRVSEYAKLHKEAESKMPSLKSTESPAKIEHHQHELAEKIRKARPAARVGDIFTPTISAEFRRLIGITMQGQTAARIKTSLRHAEPVHLRLRVNSSYPDRIPLQSTPPTLLLNLPNLPPEVDYRVAGNDLILRDTKANLIVDLILGAMP